MDNQDVHMTEDDRELAEMDEQHYEAYQEWLMDNEHPMWKDRLIECVERGHRYEEFLQSRKP